MGTMVVTAIPNPSALSAGCMLGMLADASLWPWAMLVFLSLLPGLLLQRAWLLQ